MIIHSIIGLSNILSFERNMDPDRDRNIHRKRGPHVLDGWHVTPSDCVVVTRSNTVGCSDFRGTNNIPKKVGSNPGLFFFCREIIRIHFLLKSAIFF